MTSLSRFIQGSHKFDYTCIYSHTINLYIVIRIITSNKISWHRFHIDYKNSILCSFLIIQYNFQKYTLKAVVIN